MKISDFVRVKKTRERGVIIHMDGVSRNNQVNLK